MALGIGRGFGVATDYLLEVGTEELPAGFLETAVPELAENTRVALEKNRLAHGEIVIYQTPRRLTILVKALADKQESLAQTFKGPPVSAAYDANGNPTPAALGFAKKMGIEPRDLTKETVDGVAYVMVHKMADARPLHDVLPEIVPEIVLNLTGSHFMSWDNSEIRFSRPIRWLVSLYGDQHVPVTLGQLTSHTLTQGHRFFAQQSPIAIQSVATYKSTLQEAGNVLVDQTERQAAIWADVQRAAETIHGVVQPNETLLEIVTRLVECPVAIVGGFSEAFLTLPKAVITTVMMAHQKYFPVEHPQTSQLLPHFITIANNPSAAATDTIRHGNEKVLRARLEDASFFFQEDTKQPLEAYLEKLKGITFQKGLGSLYDKAQRLACLAEKLAKRLNADSSNTEFTDVKRAALLCKADLATHLVRELTELQGSIGKEYAQLSSEKPEVATAIEEHYLPRYTGDDVAKTSAGMALSLADKLDTLMAVFSQKDARYPTGSKDPMGLRRLTYGLLQTVLQNNLSLNIQEALVMAYQNLGALAIASQDESVERAQAFIIQRFNGYLLEQGFVYDHIEAVLAIEGHLGSLSETIARLKFLGTLQANQTQFKAVYEPANRIAKILGKAYQADAEFISVKPNALTHDAEKALYKVASELTNLNTLDLTQLQSVYQTLSPYIEAFFNDVLVNDPDVAVKDNRYILLSVLNTVYRRTADYTKLVV